MTYAIGRVLEAQTQSLLFESAAEGLAVVTTALFATSHVGLAIAVGAAGAVLRLAARISAARGGIEPPAATTCLSSAAPLPSRPVSNAECEK